MSQLYRDLGQHLRLTARIPQALVDKLTALASPADLASARALVDDAMAALHHLIEGRTPFPPWPADHVPVEEGLFIIEGALAEGQNLELDYYAASTDTVTHRVVEPYRLNWHGDTPYLVGFCHHAQTERTFRLDRIRQLDSVPRDPYP